MSEYTLAGIIGIAALLLLFLSRIPVAYAMGIIGFVGYSYLANVNAGLKLLSRDLYSVFSSYGLTLIPLFIFMGYIAFHAGVSSRLYDVAYKFLGRVRGGLAMATVAACTAFGAVCGSATATAAAMAAIEQAIDKWLVGNELTAEKLADAIIEALDALIPEEALPKEVQDLIKKWAKQLAKEIIATQRGKCRIATESWKNMTQEETISCSFLACKSPIVGGKTKKKGGKGKKGGAAWRVDATCEYRCTPNKNFSCCCGRHRVFVIPGIGQLDETGACFDDATRIGRVRRWVPRVRTLVP